jgi:hypothetical protein
MGIKVYAQDDLGRKFTNFEWAMSDTKALADVLLQKNYFKVMEDFFQINFSSLDRIQYDTDIEDTNDRLWFEVRSVLEDVKKLKRAVKPESPSEISPFVLLNQTSFKMLEISDTPPDFTIDYFLYGYFLLDLEDLERFLYYLLHSGAKHVHLYCM